MSTSLTGPGKVGLDLGAPRSRGDALPLGRRGDVRKESRKKGIKDGAKFDIVTIAKACAVVFLFIVITDGVRDGQKGVLRGGGGGGEARNRV